MTRKFPCGEADYLTAYNVPLKTAAQYERRFTPRQIVELWHNGITPTEANAKDAADLASVRARKFPTARP